MRATTSVFLCPTCQTGLVRITAGSFNSTTVEVVGCCQTASDTVRSRVVPASAPTQWTVATAEAAADAFCPDCGDTAQWCKYMRTAIPGLDRYLERDLRYQDS
jgi:predicted RNA-binding Zn-ribbon protein involved in translation (DUF1610 family)